MIIKSLIYNLKILVKQSGEYLPISEIDCNLTFGELLGELINHIDLPSDTQGVLTRKSTHEKLPPNMTLAQKDIKSGEILIADLIERHTIVRLRKSSLYINGICPITRTKFKVGDEVVICESTETAFLKPAWDEFYWEQSARCLFCAEIVDPDTMQSWKVCRITVWLAHIGTNLFIDKLDKDTKFGYLVVALLEFLKTSSVTSAMLIREYSHTELLPDQTFKQVGIKDDETLLFIFETKSEGYIDFHSTRNFKKLKFQPEEALYMLEILRELYKNHDRKKFVTDIDNKKAVEISAEIKEIRNSTVIISGNDANVSQTTDNHCQPSNE